jgi:hypothetical protein
MEEQRFKYIQEVNTVTPLSSLSYLDLNLFSEIISPTHATLEMPGEDAVGVGGKVWDTVTAPV